MANDVYFGVPQVEKMRKKEPKLHQDTWFDELLNGLFGQEQPSGSVLDPDRETRASLNDAGQKAGILLNLLDPPKLLAGKALTAMGIGGAISLRGAKDLLASHGFRPEDSAALVKSGFLDAPSIGVTSRAPNDYATGPQMIFSAGKTDPARYPGTMVNRDGYFHRTRGRENGVFSQAKHDNDLSYALDQSAHYGLKDPRLSEMFPGASQAAAIAASPLFDSFHQFEKSPFGAALLRTSPIGRSPYWQGVESKLSTLSNKSGYGYGADSYTKDLIRRVNEKGFHTLDPEEQAVWREAMQSPSAMAEFKMYSKLPFSPADTAIYVPSLTNSELGHLEPWRDAGYKMFTSKHLDREVARDSIVGKRLPSVAQPDGTLWAPKPLLTDHTDSAFSRKWNDFIEPQAGSSPPLSVSSPYAQKLQAALGPVAKTPAQVVTEFPDGATATMKLEEYYGKGMLTEQEYQDALKAIDDKWPILKPGSLTNGLKAHDPFSNVPGFKPPDFHDSIEELVGSPDQLVHFGWNHALSKLPHPQWTKYKAMADTADEYNIVLDDLFTNHQLPAELYPKGVDATYEALQNKIHTTSPDWHAELENQIKKKIGFQQTPEGDSLAAALAPAPLTPTKPTSSLEAYQLIKKKHPNFWDQHQNLLENYLGYGDKGIHFDKAVEKGIISPEVNDLYKTWDSLSQQGL